MVITVQFFKDLLRILPGTQKNFAISVFVLNVFYCIYIQCQCVNQEKVFFSIAIQDNSVWRSDSGIICIPYSKRMQRVPLSRIKTFNKKYTYEYINFFVTSFIYFCFPKLNADLASILSCLIWNSQDECYKDEWPKIYLIARCKRMHMCITDYHK